MLSVRLSPLHINDGLISAWPRHNHHILGWDQTLNSDPLSAAGSIQDITLNFYLLASAQNPQNYCKGTFANIFGLWRFLIWHFSARFCPCTVLYCRFWTNWKCWCLMLSITLIQSIISRSIQSLPALLECIAVGRKNIYTSLSRSRTWWRVFNKSGLACNQCCGHQWPVFPSWPGGAPSRERATRSYFTRLQVNWCSGPQSWVTEAFLLFLMGIIKICLFFPDPLFLPAFPLILAGHVSKVPSDRSAFCKRCKHCVGPPHCCPAPARYWKSWHLASWCEV